MRAQTRTHLVVAVLALALLVVGLAGCTPADVTATSAVVESGHEAAPANAAPANAAPANAAPAGDSGGSTSTAGDSGGSTSTLGDNAPVAIAGAAPCPALSIPQAEVTVSDQGQEPLAVRHFAGTTGQRLTVSAAVEVHHEMGTQNIEGTVTDRIDVSVQRGAETGGVAPLWITLDGLDLGERPKGMAPANPVGDQSANPAPGASVCVLQGTSGETVLNSSTERWGRDSAGVLLAVLNAQMVQFPPTAIGKGAEWTVFKRQNNDGFRFTRAIWFRLDAVDDIGYELSGTATMIPDEPIETPQSVSVIDLEQSATMTFSASGRFDHPFPDSSTLTGTSSVRSVKEKLNSTTVQTVVVTPR